MIRRSSTRGLPGLPRGRCGSIATHASLDNQNRCVIAASRLDEPSQKVESANKAIDCMGSLPWRYSEADEAFFRNLTFCEEDRHLVTSAAWRGGYRWFRSTNVAPLEQ